MHILFVSFFLFKVLTSKNDDNRVKIEVFGEYLCPYTVRFVTKNIKEAIDTPDIDKIADIKLYSYGHVSKRFDNRSNTFSLHCHHGEMECLGNKIATCA